MMYSVVLCCWHVFTSTAFLLYTLTANRYEDKRQEDTGFSKATWSNNIKAGLNTRQKNTDKETSKSISYLYVSISLMIYNMFYYFIEQSKYCLFLYISKRECECISRDVKFHNLAQTQVKQLES